MIMTKQQQLELERVDGKVRPVRPMDRVEWGLTLMVCLMVEALPCGLVAQAWISYGMLAGLGAALLPLAVLAWEVKVIWDRQTKGE